MKLIVSPFNDCYHNIASEEYLSDNVDGNIFLLYINQPSIIVGKNQNTYAEINQQFVEDNDIQLVRRRSGGGAVYHDEGNLNFCFIMDKSDKSTDQLFREFTEPVIDAINQLGAPAEFSGRNDLTIDGKKFSGNAQWHSKDRSIVHGTLLFDSDLSVLAGALKVNEIKFVDKAVKSVRSRVTNIKSELSADYDMQAFIDKIIEHVDGHFETFVKYTYDESALAAIDELVAKQYGTKAWNYGKSPEFEITHRFKYAKGNVEVNLNATRGKITDAKIFGDFFGKNPQLSDVEQALVGVEFKPSAIREALEGIALSDYLDGLEANTVVSALFD